MADSYVQVAPDSTGKKLDTSQLTQDSGDVVQRQRASIADDTNVNAHAKVVNTSPESTDFGLAVRIIADKLGGTQAPILEVLQEILQELILLREAVESMGAFAGRNAPMLDKRSYSTANASDPIT